MAHLTLGFVIIFYWIRYAKSTGFVEEVSCSAQAMTIVLNKTDPDVVQWLKDPLAQPIVYVYGYKERTPCGRAIKSNDNGTVTLNFSIPYGRTCQVHLADLEPNFQTAETTVAFENNAPSNEAAKPVRINHVFCLYTKRVEALRVNDVSSNHQVVASVGGKPKPKVQMLFRDPNGRSLKAAKFGDPVGLYLALAPDNAYKAISPKHCMFSDRQDMEEPDAKTLTFVQSNCPVTELSEVIKPIQDINEEIYYTQFQAFRFGQTPTVYAHCTVEVCLQPDECNKKCYPKNFNSNLTTEELLLRFRRNSNSDDFRSGAVPDQLLNSIDNSSHQIAISNALTVLDNHLSLTDTGTGSTKMETCVDGNMRQRFLLVIGALGAILCCCIFLMLWLMKKLRFQNKVLQVNSAFPPTYYSSGVIRSQPQHVLTAFSEGHSGTLRSTTTMATGSSGHWPAYSSSTSPTRLNRVF